MAERPTPDPDAPAAEPGSAGPVVDEPVAEDPAVQPSQPESDAVSATATEPRWQAAPPPPVPPAPRRRSGGWGAVLLSLAILAVGIGAGYVLTREGGPLSSDRLDRIEAAQAELGTALQAARGESQTAADAARGTAEAATAELRALTDRLAAAEQALADSQQRAQALAAELEELRRRPPEVPDNALSQEAVAAYERELAAMRQMVETELARIRDASQAAAAQAQSAQAAGTSAETLAALSQVGIALDTGAAFGPALDRIAELDAGLPVEPLRPFSEGVEPLATLQRDFPEVARAALSAATAAGEGSGGGFGGFLRSQLGMRSLSPQEGDSTDAILSRAEARLRDGDLAGTVAELDSLAEAPKAAAQPWMQRARLRLDARAAYDTLAREVQD